MQHFDPDRVYLQDVSSSGRPPFNSNSVESLEIFQIKIGGERLALVQHQSRGHFFDHRRDPPEVIGIPV